MHHMQLLVMTFHGLNMSMQSRWQKNSMQSHFYVPYNIMLNREVKCMLYIQYSRPGISRPVRHIRLAGHIRPAGLIRPFGWLWPARERPLGNHKIETYFVIPSHAWTKAALLLFWSCFLFAYIMTQYVYHYFGEILLNKWQFCKTSSIFYCLPKACTLGSLLKQCNILLSITKYNSM